MEKSFTYADAGVDIDRADRLVDRIKKIAASTRRPGVIGDIGGFGGLFSLNLSEIEQPVLVSATDGVGTKLKIAFNMGKHDTVGIDLVAMCVNDVAVQGAKPLFFLDYFSTGRLDPEVASAVVEGVGEGCRQARCALIGGETAEMPGFYPDNEYDLAGFTVGLVDNDKLVDGSEIRGGHQLIGLASTGVHSNGFSLVRKICFEHLGLTVNDHVPDLGQTLGEALLTPTRIYSDMVQSLIRDFPIHGMVHVTGGGIPDNAVRILPAACSVRIRRDSWEIPPIFEFLQVGGNVAFEEMMRTFNCGIGYILVVPERVADEMLDRLRGMNEPAFLIGDVGERKSGEDQFQWV